MIDKRKLASIRVISGIFDIPDATNICTYQVDGWKVVDQIDKYTIGEKIVYVEIDSWLPHNLAPFLSKGKEPREYKGVKGERLRTIKLKGQVSQGLLLPLEVLPETLGYRITLLNLAGGLTDGDDVAETLGIIKWERPIDPQLAGLIRGNFPPEIPKTNQERIQNLTKEFESLKKHTWTVTEKLDGTSCTFYLDLDGEFHVCSRNLDLKRDENNTYWKMAIELNIEQQLRSLSDLGVAIQGEIIGEGIQGNQYKCKQTFKAFDVFFDGEYASQWLLQRLTDELEVDGVPVLYQNFSLAGFTIEMLLKFSEGKSQLNDSQREGLVFQSEQDPNLSFKVISNAWLLKNE